MKKRVMFFSSLIHFKFSWAVCVVLGNLQKSKQYNNYIPYTEKND